nr:MAG TPA: hypothetical protein [Caudoviricetes sp.]
MDIGFCKDFKATGVAKSKAIFAIGLLKPVPLVRLLPKVPSPVKLLAAAPT